MLLGQLLWEDGHVPIDKKVMKKLMLIVLNYFIFSW